MYDLATMQGQGGQGQGQCFGGKTKARPKIFTIGQTGKGCHYLRNRFRAYVAIQFTAGITLNFCRPNAFFLSPNVRDRPVSLKCSSQKFVAQMLPYILCYLPDVRTRSEIPYHLLLLQRLAWRHVISSSLLTLVQYLYTFCTSYQNQNSL